MRPIFFFAFLALIAAAVVPRYVGQLGGAAAVAPLGAPSAPTAAIADPVSGGSRVVIEPDARGHFRVEGAIDGRRLDFVVDTGASVVTLTESDAARLGFHPAPRDFVAQLKTANGTVRGAPVRLGAATEADRLSRRRGALAARQRAKPDGRAGAGHGAGHPDPRDGRET